MNKSFLGSKERKMALEQIFSYEVRMMILSRRRFVDQVDKTTENALLESCLIHARALNDFFRAWKGKEDDIRSSDFGYETVEPIENDKLKGRLNKSVAHLSYYRKDVIEIYRDFNLKGVLIPILKKCLDFVNYDKISINKALQAKLISLITTELSELQKITEPDQESFKKTPSKEFRSQQKIEIKIGTSYVTRDPGWE